MKESPKARNALLYQAVFLILCCFVVTVLILTSENLGYPNLYGQTQLVVTSRDNNTYSERTVNKSQLAEVARGALQKLFQDSLAISNGTVNQNRILFFGLRSSLWFYTARLSGFKGFKTQLKQYESLLQMQKTFDSKAININSYYAFVCLVKYYCWNARQYLNFEANWGPPFRRTNKIYGSKQIWSTKTSYCTSLRKALKAETIKGIEWMQKLTFECWVIPRDLEELSKRLREDSSISKLIVKPLAAQAGSGIYLADRSNMPFSKAKRAVLQSYLDDPLLIDDKKWDMRIYIAVTSVLPIRAYMHRQGFVRFASGNYTKSKGAGKTSFLTNLSINNKIKPTEALTWNFKELYEYFGQDADGIFSDIREAIAMLLVATEGSFAEFYETNVGNGFRCVGCYQILGIDVILDKKRKPHIIEINGNPTLRFKSEVLNQDVKQMEQDFISMMFNQLNANSIDSISHRLYKACYEDKDGCKWLTEPQLQYVLMMAKEEAFNGNYDRIYPPPKLSKADKDLWRSFIDHLYKNDHLLRLFHNLLHSF